MSGITMDAKQAAFEAQVTANCLADEIRYLLNYHDAELRSLLSESRYEAIKGWAVRLEKARNALEQSWNKE